MLTSRSTHTGLSKLPGPLVPGLPIAWEFCRASTAMTGVAIHPWAPPGPRPSKQCCPSLDFPAETPRNSFRPDDTPHRHLPASFAEASAVLIDPDVCYAHSSSSTEAVGVPPFRPTLGSTKPRGNTVVRILAHPSGPGVLPRISFSPPVSTWTGMGSSEYSRRPSSSTGQGNRHEHLT